MPAPSPLAITTGSLSRFVKDEASYHKELKQQEASIAKLEQNQSDDENAEYLLRQERKALEETKAIFPQLRQKIQETRAKLEQQLEQEDGTPEEITKAKEAINSSLEAEHSA